MRWLIFGLFALCALNAYAETEEYFSLVKKKGCYVKAYKNKKFHDMSYNKFMNKALYAKPHKKHPKFFVFKENEQIYVTKAHCLEPANTFFSNDDEEILGSLQEKKYDNANKKIHKQQVENLQFREEKWMIEFDVGTSVVPDKSQVYPNYADLSGTIDGHVVNFREAKKSTYKTGGSLGLSLGYRYSETSFLTFKIKRSTGKKTDAIDCDVDGTPAECIYDYKDTFTTLLLGNKFIFLPDSHLRPTLGLFAGINTIESKNTIFDAEFRSSGLAAQAEIGVEYFFNNNFSLGITSGYQYLGTQTFRVVDKKNEVTDTGYKTKMSYSNFFYTGGIKVYF